LNWSAVHGGITSKFIFVSPDNLKFEKKDMPVQANATELQPAERNRQSPEVSC